jgi:hypothetical protein
LHPQIFLIKKTDVVTYHELLVEKKYHELFVEDRFLLDPHRPRPLRSIIPVVMHGLPKFVGALGAGEISGDAKVSTPSGPSAGERASQFGPTGQWDH